MSNFWNELRQRRTNRRESWNGYRFYGYEVLTDELERRLTKAMTEARRLL